MRPESRRTCNVKLRASTITSISYAAAWATRRSESISRAIASCRRTIITGLPVINKANRFMYRACSIAGSMCRRRFACSIRVGDDWFGTIRSTSTRSPHPQTRKSTLRRISARAVSVHRCPPEQQVAAVNKYAYQHRRQAGIPGPPHAPNHARPDAAGHHIDHRKTPRDFGHRGGERIVFQIARTEIPGRSTSAAKYPMIAVIAAGTWK